MAENTNNVVNTESQVEEVNTSNTDTESEKTYTKEEVMTLLQQEADRRVSSALKKQ